MSKKGEKMNYQKMSVKQAIEAIKAEYDISNYKLARVLGIRQQIMITRYLAGEVRSVNTKIAMAIFRNYNILVDSFNSPEELEACYEAL